MRPSPRLQHLLSISLLAELFFPFFPSSLLSTGFLSLSSERVKSPKQVSNKIWRALCREAAAPRGCSWSRQQARTLRITAWLQQKLPQWPWKRGRVESQESWVPFTPLLKVPAPSEAQDVPQSFRSSPPSSGITHLPLPHPPGSLKQLGSSQAFPKEAG